MHAAAARKRDPESAAEVISLLISAASSSSRVTVDNLLRQKDGKGRNVIMVALDSGFFIQISRFL